MKFKSFNYRLNIRLLSMLMIIISGMFLTSCGSNNTKEIPLRSGKYGYLFILRPYHQVWISLEQVGSNIKGIELSGSPNNIFPRSFEPQNEYSYFIWACQFRGVRVNNVIKITNFKSFKTTPDGCNNALLYLGAQLTINSNGLVLPLGSSSAGFKNAEINQFKSAVIYSMQSYCRDLKHMVQFSQMIYQETIACSNQLKIPSS